MDQRFSLCLVVPCGCAEGEDADIINFSLVLSNFLFKLNGIRGDGDSGCGDFFVVLILRWFYTVAGCAEAEFRIVKVSSVEPRASTH